MRYPLALCVLPALLAFVPRSFSSAPAKPPPLPPPLLCSRPLGPQSRTPRDPRAPRPARSGLSTRGRGSAPAGRPPPPVPASPGAEARRGARRVPAPHPAQSPHSPHFLCVSGARQRGRAALPRDRRPPRWGKPRAAQTAEKRGVRKNIYILNNNKIKRCRRDPQDLPVIPGSEGRERPGSPSLKKGAKCK